MNQWHCPDTWKCSVPEGNIGDFSVKRFAVSEEEAQIEKIRSVFSTGVEPVPSGVYVRLMQGSTLWMSNTPSERRDHSYAIGRATGNVLVTGLGLGLVVEEMLAKKEVKSVTVHEKYQEVIDLVSPTLVSKWGDRFNVINVDALAYKPRKYERYDVIWHDIWPDIATTNLEDMTVLKKKWARRVDVWQGCWREEYLRHQKKREDKEERQYNLYFG